jgi:leucyl-tRNA synthetase
LRLTTYLKYVETFLEKKTTDKPPSEFSNEKEKPVRVGGADLFADKVFYHRMIHNINKAKHSYQTMKFREALHYCFYELHKIKDDYIFQVDGVVKKEFMLKFIEYEALIMSPIRPHFSEHIWELIGKTTKIENEVWPDVGESDLRIIRSYFYFQGSIYNFRSKLNKDKDAAKKKNKPWTHPTSAYIYVVDHYSTWQLDTLKILREIVKPGDFPKDVAQLLKDKVDPKQMKNVMMFVSYIKLEFEKYGMDALNDELPFDEYEIMNENASFIKLTLDLKELTIYKESDTNVHDPQARMKQISTGNPQIHFE